MMGSKKSTAPVVELIVNQDGGKVPAKLAELRKLAHTYDMKLNMCEGQDLDYTIREALKNKKLTRLIIGGGDGSISKAASLILRFRPKVELAVLPLGTANYYAKTLGISKNLKDAFEIAHGDKIEKRHMCRANKREFLIGVNVGTTSRMFSQVTDEEKQRFGKLAYVRGIFRVLMKTTPPDVEVKANGKKHIYRSTELVVLNQYIPESVKLTPYVDGGAPYFEIITYGLGKSRLSPLFAVVVFAVTLGRNQKYLKRIKTTKAVIKSRKNLPVAVDGDSIGRLPLKIELVEKPVTFLCGVQ